MTILMQGPFDNDRAIAESDPLRRGTRRLLTTPSFVSAGYTARYDLDLLGKVMQPYAHAKVGLVGLNTLPYGTMQALMDGPLGAARVVDATDMVDRIKVLKSEEELALIRGTAAMQDRCMEAVLARIEPGIRDLEAAGIAEQCGRALGSEQGIFLCGSSPVGQATPFGNRHIQNRVIREGDYFSLLIESSGPGGFYTELGRTFVLGKAPGDMLEEFEFTKHARQFVLDRLRPDARCADLWNDYNAFMVSHGRPAEDRLFCHGQGYDMVERPLVRFDEDMPIRAGMNIVCHPTYLTRTTLSWICDNYVVDTEGKLQRIHELPEKIFEVA